MFLSKGYHAPIPKRLMSIHISLNDEMNYQNDDIMDIFLGTDHDQCILLHFPVKLSENKWCCNVSDGPLGK